MSITNLRKPESGRLKKMREQGFGREFQLDSSPIALDICARYIFK